MSRRWTEEELLIAINLYCKLPFGQQHSGNQKVRKLADLLGRTPGSINMKLNNFAALDGSLERTGLENYSQLDEQVWKKYWDNLDEMAGLSEYLLDSLQEHSEKTAKNENDRNRIIKERREQYGRELRTDQKRRVGQHYFRNVVLSNYEYQCSVCRLNHPRLLDAAHILDWAESEDKNLRVNPRNGMAMCAIHHRAFDQDLLLIEADSLTIDFSSELTENNSEPVQSFFLRYQGEPIFVPEKLGPQNEFLK